MSRVGPSAAIIIAIVLIAAIAFSALYGNGEFSLNGVLNPSSGLQLNTILAIAFILGIMHGITPDEHTWPITFSYAIGSYSTEKGMKAGLAFSTGFTLQRAFLTTLGFLGLALVYKQYNLDGPVYMLVGLAMAIAGMYILRKKMYLHLPIDVLFRGSEYHSKRAELLHTHEPPLKEIPLKLAVVHGLIAGFGFGAYSTIITFILAPQVPGLIYAPLPGLFFGLGTMFMQIIFGALFANLARIKKISEQQVSLIGRRTAGRTLLYGGTAFSIIGLLIIFFPFIDKIAISTGNPIPNLDSIGIATFLVLIVVGVIGLGSLALGFREMLDANKRAKSGPRPGPIRES